MRVLGDNPEEAIAIAGGVIERRIECLVGTGASTDSAYQVLIDLGDIGMRPIAFGPYLDAGTVLPAIVHDLPDVLIQLVHHHAGTIGVLAELLDLVGPLIALAKLGIFQPRLAIVGPPIG